MPIYFIRHGQSEFNAAHQPGEDDPLIFDAPLTEKGRRQADEARALVAELNIKQVITSPLTRAIQTSLRIFGDTAPITVSAAHREKLIHSCDMGSHRDQLQEQFPELSFAHLDEIWWHDGPKNAHGVPVEPDHLFDQRMEAFRISLQHMQDRPLAIVGHGDAFRALIGRGMENCEIHRYHTIENLD